MGSKIRIVVGLATTGTRPRSLVRTLDSLRHQVDEILIYDNSKQDQDLTDNGKFRWLNDQEDVYYFSCDDDIVYPQDYVQKTIEAIEGHGCIVSYHGRILQGLNRNYYDGHAAFSCLRHYPQTKKIDVAGTGVTAFRTSYFKSDEIWNSDFKRMSDLVFSLEVAKQGKKIMHIGHKGRWIVDIPQPKGTTIWETEHLNQTKQIQLANEIYKLNYGSN